jgi:hypothetical protein
VHRNPAHLLRSHRRHIDESSGPMAEPPPNSIGGHETVSVDYRIHLFRRLQDDPDPLGV